LATEAKLNVDIKLFDTAALFEEVYENPEANGFTNVVLFIISNGKRKK